VAAAGLAAAVTMPAGSGWAETYRVGPDQDHESLAEVADLLEPGDVVEIIGGASYDGGVVFTRPGRLEQKITVRGIPVGGKRPVIHGGRNTIEARANHYVFEELELSGGSYRCFFHHAHDITVRRTLIHDCPKHGVLGADQDSGTLLLEYSEIYGCGEGDRYHQVYAASDETAYPGAVFRIQHCYLHDATGGNNVKSRAERNEIYFNWIEGAGFHELELVGPEGQDPRLRREDSDIVGNVFRKTNNAYTARVGGDGTGESNGRYRFVHNTFIVPPDHRPIFRIFHGIESIQMHNNAIVRLDGGPVVISRSVEARWATGQERIFGSYNWIPAGSSAVPVGWSHTLEGTDPGFVDLRNWDLRPGPQSPLLDAAAPNPPSPEAFAIPAPLTVLSSQPPPRRSGVSVRRPRLGAPDIGAYEGGAPLELMVPVSTAGGRAADGSSPPSLGPARPGAAGGRCGCRLVGSREAGGGAPVGWSLALLGLAIALRRPS